MRFAYADPPYHRMGKKMYSPFHPEASVWDDPQTHLDLIGRLVEHYPDGWALSCNPADLRWLLPACPETARIAAWTKTFFQIRPLATVQYAWEPVIFVGGRKVPNRKPMVRDWLSCARHMRKGLPGAKPDAFNRWVLDLLGYDAGLDEIDDLFPGTGGMTAMATELRLM
jgi:hypothetical protein